LESDCNPDYLADYSPRSKRKAARCIPFAVSLHIMHTPTKNFNARNGGSNEADYFHDSKR
jgi:hypothetical protein